MKDFRAAFGAAPAESPLPGAAAVLVPVVDAAGGPYLLMERRPEGPSTFAGQLGFPGGRIEAGDESPLAAALREADEEVGWDRADVEVVGHLTTMDNHLGRRVTAFVGIVPLLAIPASPASPQEVAELLLVPLPGLREPGIALPAEAPGRAYQVLRYESRVHDARARPLHYWHLRSRQGTTAVLWGLSAEMVARLMARLWSWSPPSLPRRVEGSDYLP